MVEPVASGPQVIGVGELLAGLRSHLEERIGRLWVVGEVSNLRRPGSGHVYFTLKDERGQLRAALFRSSARRLAFEPEEGLEVLVYGELTVYEPRGDLQLIVRQLEPRGVGALQVAFEQLRRRLEAEGLFDASRKRALPPRPTRIGVVTSSSGAAIRDVLEVTRRRLPALPVLIAPTRVQGIGAEDEIAAALDGLGNRPDVSVVLLVRGGGSLEDLQPFNTEVLARAVARAPVPVVTGVGHEVDVTIADLVADARAPTPSAAAELAVPDRRALRGELLRRWDGLGRAARSALVHASHRLARRRESLRGQAPPARLAAHRERWIAAHRALLRVAPARVERGRGHLAALAASLDSLSPLAVLGRGYGLVRRARDGGIVREAGDVAADERLSIRVARAELEAVLASVRSLPDG
jgi:exodeoxyribonuclease VII large subunit